MHTAVHVNGLAAHAAGCIHAQKGAQLGDFFQGNQALERGLVAVDGQQLVKLSNARSGAGQDGAAGDSVYADVLRA